jgi:uncharacterized repeat protein (TIGR03803 family)
MNCIARLVLSTSFVWLAFNPSAHAQYQLTTLVNFNGGNADPKNGGDPNAGLTADTAGNLFGTTQLGGTFTCGTVFKLAAGTHAFSTLVSINPAADPGIGPLASVLLDASGNLYGTTYFQGADNAGTVFKVAAGTNTLTTLVSFNYTNGCYPSCALVADANGNLYGTTFSGGGSGSNGTVFRVAAGTNVLTTLAEFNGTNGYAPYAGLIADASGNLYSTTSGGGASGLGTIFEVAAATHALTTLATFNGTNGAKPFGQLFADASGNLYGTTSAGGSNGLGTVFELTAGSHTLRTLASFDGTNGSDPAAGLLADASGNLYGTTRFGGDLTLDSGNGAGTVFELTATTHELVSLFEFNGANGRNPLCDLISDANGCLYGTTQGGGSVGYGTVFELSPVPEPSALSLSAAGFAPCMAAICRRRWPSVQKSRRSVFQIAFSLFLAPEPSTGGP